MKNYTGHMKFSDRNGTVGSVAMTVADRVAKVIQTQNDASGGGRFAFCMALSELLTDGFAIVHTDGTSALLVKPVETVVETPRIKPGGRD